MTRVDTNSFAPLSQNNFIIAFPSAVYVPRTYTAGVYYKLGIGIEGEPIPFAYLSKRPSFFTIGIGNIQKERRTVGNRSLETDQAK